MNQEGIAVFFERLDALPKGERTALKRGAGTMLEQADGRAVRVFYQCLPADASPWQEGRMFAAACIHCLWEPEVRDRKPLEEIFFRLGQDQTISKSMGHRLETLLDLPWAEDGFLLTKLFRLIQLARSKGYAVDCERLLKDLLSWNGEKQVVQHKWAKALYIKPEISHDSEKGD